MFEAIVIVCAANFAYEVNNDSCFQLSDVWGPYVTQENCDIRTAQMVEDVLRGALNPMIFQMYADLAIPADQLYAEGACTELEGDEA